MLNEVNVNSYKLYSSSEVNLRIEEVKNLKTNLLKIFPDVTVSLLKHEDKTHTVLNVYSIAEIKDDENINDMILHQIYLDYLNK
ncbi:MAG: hypothetical protein SPLUMA1_SPLUMAMAG1_00682 [uncultured Sulfurimonas sp.]|nr:MAG: hypothetical protein SPLUMA1_SPLUMAMAG1_00682 [uncultured Sulfurimonas sp.]